MKCRKCRRSPLDFEYQRKGSPMLTTETQTIEQRFNNALKAIRKQGITARRNVMGCCRSCIDLGLADNVPVIWQYGGQGNRHTISGDDYNYSTVYFSHSNLADDEGLTPSGVAVIEAFESQGFEVDWERNNYKTIRVLLDK